MDDGAESMEEALAMAEMAAVSGISCMAATPHWQLSQKDRFPDRMQKRQWILEQLNETVYAEFRCRSFQEWRSTDVVILQVG